MQIFIVDKNASKLKGIVDFLKENGFEVRVFDKISDFQKIVRNREPDIIICNPIVEGLSPYYLVKWVKSNEMNIPIIAYSENPSKETIINAKKYGVNSFMIFPFKNEELLLRIKRILKLPDNFKMVNTINKEQEQLIKKDRIKNEILINIDKLPSFPAIIQEVERLINREDSNARDFEEVIEKDQVITAKILKIVNSPFYSLTRKFTTISESVAYIGLDSLRSIIYSAAVSNLLKISLPTYGYKREQLWKHSYSTAIFSKYIGLKIGLKEKIAEELFVGGLIHDIGKIVIGFLAKKENIIITNISSNVNHLDLERKNFYFNHAEIGGMVADKWRLPDIHKDIITKHHSPKNRIEAIVALANLLSKEMLNIQFRTEKESEEYFLKALKIDKEVLEKIKDECYEKIEQIESSGAF